MVSVTARCEVRWPTATSRSRAAAGSRPCAQLAGHAASSPARSRLQRPQVASGTGSPRHSATAQRRASTRRLRLARSSGSGSSRVRLRRADSWWRRNGRLPDHRQPLGGRVVQRCEPSLAGPGPLQHRVGGLAVGAAQRRRGGLQGGGQLVQDLGGQDARPAQRSARARRSPPAGPARSRSPRPASGRSPGSDRGSGWSRSTDCTAAWMIISCPAPTSVASDIESATTTIDLPDPGAEHEHEHVADRDADGHADRHLDPATQPLAVGHAEADHRGDRGEGRRRMIKDLGRHEPGQAGRHGALGDQEPRGPQPVQPFLGRPRPSRPVRSLRSKALSFICLDRATGLRSGRMDSPTRAALGRLRPRLDRLR